MTLYRNFKPLGFPAQNGQRRRAFAIIWADSGQIRPRTIAPFSFSSGLKEFLENYRKMLKTPDQFC
jgi:hypothetical protein